MSAKSCVVSGWPVAGFGVTSQSGIGARSVTPPLSTSLRQETARRAAFQAGSLPTF